MGKHALPLKWVGGKTQLLKEILPRLPKQIETYIEPFIGGGSVFFALAKENRFKHAVINDFNPELSNLYSVVRDYPKDLMESIDDITSKPDWNTREFFNEMRNTGYYRSEIGRAARFMYLNRTAFNGMYRVNKRGEFNVPFGKYKNPALYDRETLLSCSAALQGATILQGDFEPVVANAQPGDCCYFDPPYVPVSKTASFTAYSGEFGEKEQRRLAKLYEKLATRGVHCVLSNSDTPLVRELYSQFSVLTVQARRAVNSDATKRGPVNEVLVVSQLFDTTDYFGFG